MIKKFGGTTRYSYQAGDEISLRTKKNLKIRGTIWDLSDSSLSVGQNYIIRFDEIKSVRREVYAPKLFSRLLLILGVGYLGLDVGNNLINNQQVFNKSTLIISGSVIGAGLILLPLCHKNLPVGKRWRLYLLDSPRP